MSATRYFAGSALMVIAILVLLTGTIRMRRRLAPDVDGTDAVLAAAVLVIAALILTGELLGAIDLFRPIPVFAALCTIGIVGLRLGVRAPTRRPVVRRTSVPRGADRRLAIIVAVAAAVVATQWLAFTLTSLDDGMWLVDSLWYHGPFAADFLQHGSVTVLHYFPQPAGVPTFYPANFELLAALSELPWHSDTLSMLLNLSVAGLVVLALWTAAGSRRDAPICVLAGLVLLSMPVFAAAQAGQTYNDLFALAMFMASVALAINTRGNTFMLAVAALAGGLAVGTKLSAVAPTIALAAGAILLVEKGRRGRAAIVWLGGLFVGGGFWYLRNLAVTGNPIPWLKRLGPLALPHPSTLLPHRELTSIVDLAGGSSFWSGVPLALKFGFGPAWPAILTLAVLGVAIALLRGPRTYRMLAGVASLSFIAYLFTPQSGFLFIANTRHSTFALMLSLTLLAVCAHRRTPAWRWLLTATMMATLIVTETGGMAWAVRYDLASALLVVGAVLLRCGGSRVLRVRGPRWPAAAAVAALSAVVIGLPLENHFLAQRYAVVSQNPLTSPPGGFEPLYVWAKAPRGRIGVVGLAVDYPLYGSRLTNQVSYVGRELPNGGFEDVHSCAEWVRALAAGRYQFVVVAPLQWLAITARPVPEEPIQARWTRQIPGAVEVLSTPGPVTVFRVPHTVSSSNCGTAA